MYTIETAGDDNEQPQLPQQKDDKDIEQPQLPQQNVDNNMEPPQLPTKKEKLTINRSNS